MVAHSRFFIASACAAVSLVLSSCAPQEAPIRPSIQSMMASVPAGTARRATPAWRFGDQFAPEGGDLLNLMEIQGASYVVRAPASEAGGCGIEVDVRSFVDGNEWRPRGADGREVHGQDLSPATMWLVDILTWPDWVSSSGYSYRVRVQPLDGPRDWQISRGGFFRSHDPKTGGPLLNAFLYQCAERETGLEKEVPLACLYKGPTDKNYKPAAGRGADDAEQLARASRFGVVFYVRLRQKPAAATTQPAGVAPS